MKTSLIITALLASLVSAASTSEKPLAASDKHLHHQREHNNDDDDVTATATATATAPSASVTNRQKIHIETDDRDEDKTITKMTIVHDDDGIDDEDDNYLDVDEFKSKIGAMGTATSARMSHTTNGSICIVEMKTTKCHKIPKKTATTTSTTTTTATSTGGAAAERTGAGSGVLLGAAVAVAGAVVGL